MISVIPQLTQPVKLILKGILCFLMVSCWHNPPTPDEIKSLLRQPQGRFKIITKNGKEIKLRLALTMAQKTQGLSGVMPEEFAEDEGMFFFYERLGPRYFWMPNTFFNLHIIFLNEDLVVLKIAANMPFHKGIDQSIPIPRTPTYLAQHVLEIKSSSTLVKEIKIGDQLKWIGALSLAEIKSNIHLLQ